ncbi:MAG: monooxygenase [Nitrobacter sp. 62-13]|uniref:FAD-dependent monooxygenase n=1 Tax=Nitrobacter sp. 62-13 TaxID=1895797 RepID=UPI00095C7060|nr:FAD-dependent monooxygenase [Nitrobacter sp. 62-13]OJU28676.1 MAG: monooxygenase [Nitrobacter sp. 62-13]
MTPSRTVVIAGAGIGGLTASLALAAKGFRVLIIETAERLEEIGAGLQLSPNATRILIGLGLHPRLSARALVPEAVSIMSARHGGEICRLPLGEAATLRAGAPYWVMHRGGLQAALLEQVRNHPDIELRLGTAVEDATSHADGVTVSLGGGTDRAKTAWALIGADGVWSTLRTRLFPDTSPQFSGLIAWRGTVEASQLPHDRTAQYVRLWMGPHAHLVSYPISGGRQINIVAVMPDIWNQPGWSAPGDAADIKHRFAQARWSEPARTMIGAVAADGWRKWALFTIPPMAAWHRDAMALLGDAAHAMLPFAAQGAGMAIEDAAVLAQCLGEAANENAGAAAALARYTGLRRARVARVQALAERNGRISHLAGAAALARDLVIKAIGPQRMLARQDWIYNWRPDLKDAGA